MIKINHLALYVTDIRRSIDFYEKILHSHVYGPISPVNLTFKGQIADKLLSTEHKSISQILSLTSPKVMKNAKKNIAFIASNGSDYDILLVENRDLKDDYIISVEGKTIYGFSYTLSPKVDMEILSWDLHNQEVSFEHGDPELDGTIYSQDCPNHSLYIKDPDGRVIELKTGSELATNKPFIQNIDTVTLHVTSPSFSKNFYTNKLGLIINDELTNFDKKHFLWLANDQGKKVILLYGLTGLDGVPVRSGGYGLDHIALNGITIKGSPGLEVTDIFMNPDMLKIKTHSDYLCDQDGYWIESIQDQ